MFFKLLMSIMAVIFMVGSTQAQVHDPRALAADPKTATAPIAPKLTGLGHHHIPVTTSNPESQYFFDQGVRLFLGFNHSEALRSFKEAIRLDPENAMAYWGWALVLGPNLNLPMQDNVVPRAYQAIQQAVQLSPRVSAKERGYITALATRYGPTSADRAALDHAYSAAMKQLMDQYPDDNDIATLYVAAVMNTNPWNYWYPDGSPKGRTAEILAILDRVTARAPDHAGAHHYLIHLVEAFRPELAERSADLLRPLMPGAGHLVHMPSHIYMRLGRYQDSYEVNSKAILADQSYITQCQAQGLYPLRYFPHNMHFLAWSAMFLGRSSDALNAARSVANPDKFVTKLNNWGLNETFLAQPMFVMIRFGQWEDMLAEPRPVTKGYFLNGIWHYGRGLAYLHQGKLSKARAELKELVAWHNRALKDTAYNGAFYFNDTLFAIAEAVLQAEIHGKAGDYTKALSQADRAVRLEESLDYNEPPNWYFPTRHILGAVLMDAGKPAEAEVVYWADLQQNPDNGYALFGLHQALMAQGKADLAAVIKTRFDKAWSRADMALSSSRF
ncbi:tetratricopeptide repeat protein [Paremcibacter congregatus]|uniref:tetratricopeptide repeat protein n=1 Tax=Paremcibacter congregatus TaxID=2043170 RepID=UPI003A92D182